MKLFILTLIFIALSASVSADGLIQFSDGTTAWRNSNGEIWGKTSLPSQPEQDNNNVSGFGSDGTFYAPAGQNQVLDTNRGGFVPVR